MWWLWQIYLTYVNINFKEDDLYVFVTQQVESWSYSDTRPTPDEAKESVLLISIIIQQAYK